MVVSSGMQSMETMRRVYKTVREHNQNFAILQCTSAYPLEAQDVNLRVITVRNISISCGILYMDTGSTESHVVLCMFYSSLLATMQSLGTSPSGHVVYSSNAFAPPSLPQEYQKEFPDIPIGYSGHESGIYISVAAVALGAKVIERHVTLDKRWKGSDHAASLEPQELKELVASVRLVEAALGSPTKTMLPCERPCHDKVGTAPLGPPEPL